MSLPALGDLKAELTDVYTKLYAAGYCASPISLKVKLAALEKALVGYKNPSCVDFGGGKGVVLDYLRKKGLIRSGTVVDLVDARAPSFVQAAWEPLPHKFDVAISTDFLEHLPPETVEATIKNIVATAPHGFHSISTRPDTAALAGRPPLHLTVKPGAWWAQQFREAGAKLTVYRDYVGRNCEIGY